MTMLYSHPNGAATYLAKSKMTREHQLAHQYHHHHHHRDAHLHDPTAKHSEKHILSERVHSGRPQKGSPGQENGPKLDNTNLLPLSPNHRSSKQDKYNSGSHEDHLYKEHRRKSHRHHDNKIDQVAYNGRQSPGVELTQQKKLRKDNKTSIPRVVTLESFQGKQQRHNKERNETSTLRTVPTESTKDTDDSEEQNFAIHKRMITRLPQQRQRHEQREQRQQRQQLRQEKKQEREGHAPKPQQQPQQLLQQRQQKQQLQQHQHQHRHHHQHQQKQQQPLRPLQALDVEKSRKQDTPPPVKCLEIVTKHPVSWPSSSSLSSTQLGTMESATGVSPAAKAHQKQLPTGASFVSRGHSSTNHSNQVSAIGRLRRVNFDMVEIREYARCLGDNPMASPDGPSISLDWNYVCMGTKDVIQYEIMKQQRPKPICFGGSENVYDNNTTEHQQEEWHNCDYPIPLPGHVREELMLDHTDCTLRDIDDNIRQICISRCERFESLPDELLASEEQRMQWLG